MNVEFKFLYCIDCKDEYWEGKFLMKEITIVLCSLDDVMSFVNTISCFEGKACIHRGMYRIDAKSIVGIFSLDLKKPLVLEIEEWKEEYIPLLDRFLYEKR